MREQLKKMILNVLPEVDCVIGWGPGYDALHDAPLFMREAGQVEAFMGGALGAFGAVHNPALFLPDLLQLSGKKIGVVVKGCDSRSVVQLLTENLIRRENLVIIGFPCAGVLDIPKLERALASLPGAFELGEVETARLEKGRLLVQARGQEYHFVQDTVTADKCLRCTTPNAVISDYFAGIARDVSGLKDNYDDVAALERMSLDDRFAFWENEMSRCVRCHACRNACPLCVCRDHCLASSRDPHWVSQANSSRDKFMFQIIHAMHLAGRCTGCGECQRACPVGIPVLLLKRSLSRRVEDLFGFQAGLDTETEPPLLTFQVEEEKIKERNW